jgi:hypothetical protein
VRVPAENNNVANHVGVAVEKGFVKGSVKLPYGIRDNSNLASIPMSRTTDGRLQKLNQVVGKTN